jgi:hypothetical protein
MIHLPVPAMIRYQPGFINLMVARPVLFPVYEMSGQRASAGRSFFWYGVELPGVW